MGHLALFLSIAVAVVSAGPAWADVLRLHGSTTVVANLMKPHQTAIEEQSGHRLEVVANGSGRGLQDLVEGRADIGMISAPLEITVGKIKKSNATFKVDDLIAHQIGETRVAFVVHPSNPIRSLSLEQIASMLSGKIKNWQEVGGQSQPIVIVGETRGGGLRTMAEEALLGGDSMVASTKEVPNGGQVIKVVAQMPMALGVAAAAAVDGQVSELSTESPIVQPLIFVTRGEPNPAQRAVIDATRAAGGRSPGA